MTLMLSIGETCDVAANAAQATPRRCCGSSGSLDLRALHHLDLGDALAATPSA
jgi:hypothetical protein